jgi:ectoine hydroxylase-related dioxygenase (phytanoyl-CoA dioxygenase family)
MSPTHPRNQGFHWPSGQLRSDHLGPDHVRQYDEEGYFLLKGVLPAETVGALIEAIDPVEQAAEEALRNKVATNKISKADAITFTTFLVTRSAVARDFTCHRVFQDVCRDLIGAGARLYHDQAVFKKPGNPEEFPWHQDNGYTFTEPQAGVTCWVPLTAATVENGCPWVIPGAHREGTLAHVWTDLGYQCDVSGRRAVPVEADVGDIVVFSRITPHRTGPNLTSAVRKAYVVQYAAHDCVAWREGQEPIPQDDPERQYVVC